MTDSRTGPRAPESIPLTWPSTDNAELAAVAEVLDSGWLAGQGPRSEALEEDFRRLTGRQHAVAVSNCTAGLHLALAALGAGPGDEILVADYSFLATGHAVLYCGAAPVFVDVRADTGTIAPDAAQAAIGPRTRGIVAVDALGMPPTGARWSSSRGAAGSSSWRTRPARRAAGTRAGPAAASATWRCSRCTRARGSPAARGECSSPTIRRWPREHAAPPASGWPAPTSGNRRPASPCPSSPASVTTTSSLMSWPLSLRCSSASSRVPAAAPGHRRAVRGAAG